MGRYIAKIVIDINFKDLYEVASIEEKAKKTFKWHFLVFILKHRKRGEAMKKYGRDGIIIVYKTMLGFVVFFTTRR